jgi:hypothetical protein
MWRENDVMHEVKTKQAWISGDASQEMGDNFSFKSSNENLTTFSDTTLKDIQNAMPEFDMICFESGI